MVLKQQSVRELHAEFAKIHSNLTKSQSFAPALAQLPESHAMRVIPPVRSHSAGDASSGVAMGRPVFGPVPPPGRVPVPAAVSLSQPMPAPLSSASYLQIDHAHAAASASSLSSALAAPRAESYLEIGPVSSAVPALVRSYSAPVPQAALAHPSSLSQVGPAAQEEKDIWDLDLDPELEPGDEIPSYTHPEEGDIIEQLLATRIRRGQTEYLVDWHDPMGVGRMSWEPYETIREKAADLLDNFHAFQTGVVADNITASPPPPAEPPAAAPARGRGRPRAAPRSRSRAAPAPGAGTRASGIRRKRTASTSASSRPAAAGASLPPLAPRAPRGPGARASRARPLMDASPADEDVVSDLEGFADLDLEMEMERRHVDPESDTSDVEYKDDGTCSRDFPRTRPRQKSAKCAKYSDLSYRDWT